MALFSASDAYDRNDLSLFTKIDRFLHCALYSLLCRRKLAAVKRGVRGGELRGGIGGMYYLFLFLTHVQLNLRSWLIEDPRMECLGRCRKR